MKDIIIRDPLYNYISIERDSIIRELIDTPEFQRLRYIKQLGVSFLTYPCANHTRFSHSLGAYHLCKRLCEILKIEQNKSELIEIAALLHDIGHQALSHVFEKMFSTKNHEIWTREIITNKETEINRTLSKNYNPEEISNRFIEGPSDPPYYHHIISSQLDIDRFDYLLRDSYFTGNPCGMFDIERLLRVLIPRKDLLTVDRNKGRYVLEQHIMSRYLMYNSVYKHRVTIGIEEMLKMIFKRAIDIQEIKGIPPESPIYLIVTGVEFKLEVYLKLKDDHVFSALTLWKESDDAILRDLCRNFFSRDILKSIKYPITINSYEQNKKKIENILHYHEIEPEYNVIFLKGEKKLAYVPYDVTSKEKDRDDAIFFDDGITEIVEGIPSLSALKIEIEPNLYLPKKVHEEVMRIINNTRG